MEQEKKEVKREERRVEGIGTMSVLLSEHLGHLLRDVKVVRINNRLEIIGSFKTIDKVAEYFKVLFNVKIEQ